MKAADDLVRGLRHFYPENVWVLLPQVRDGTGWRGNRTADAIAMNCWPSRGLELHGFEVKVSRSDWRRELKKPEKAESVCRYCDRWYVVVPKVGVVDLAELPPTWGLIVLDDDPRIARDAPKLDAAPFDRVFIAAVLRAAQRRGGVDPDEHNRLLREQFKVGYRAGAETRRDLRSVRWQLDSLEHLEGHTKRILDTIRKELKELRPFVELPADLTEPEAATDNDGHEARVLMRLDGSTS